MRAEDIMTRVNFNTESGGEALGDYWRAKRVWEALVRKQRENDGQTTFLLEEKLLYDLGFAKEDFRANVRDLQGVLTKLQELTWHWDRCGPLFSRPGEPGPVAYIVERTLVIGAQFSAVRTAFVAYSTQDEEPHQPA
jgi:hypothetical protein